MNWLTDLFKRDIQSLELKRDASPTRHVMPKVPVLDTSWPSLTRYATKSELVYACIEKKAQVACDPELIVQKRTKSGDWEKVEDHIALQPFLNPNPWDDGESLTRTWIASENIAGEFYAEIVRSGAGYPVQLYPLRPDCIFPQYHATSKGWVLDHYVYRLDGYEVKFKPDDLLIRRRHGLGSLYSGTSPLAVALGAVDADISATEYIRAFYNNGGTPSGILTLEDRNLSDEEADAMRQKWTARYGRGGRNRGGIAILDKRASYEPIGANLDQLNSESLTSIDETRICMAFGVPPVIIGAYVGLVNVNQRASFKGAMEEFWMNTMSPELKSIRKFLTRKWLPLFGEEEAVRNDTIRFFWDISNVEALQEDVDALHKRIGEGYKNGVYKLNEARAKVGLDEVEPEIGEEFYKAPVPMRREGDVEDEPKEKPKKSKVAACPMCGVKDAFIYPVPHDSSKGWCSAERCEWDVDAKLLDAEILIEKKTVEYEGLTLYREPTELEKSIDLKAIVESYESGREGLTKAILSIRRELIEQAVTAVPKRDDADIFTLTLTPPKNAYKAVGKWIEAAVKEGRRQIQIDGGIKGEFNINVYQNLRFAIETKGIIDELIRVLIEVTVSRIINGVQTAAADIYASLRVLGLDAGEVESRMREELRDRSDAPFEGYARQGINAAVNAGRREEMDARKDEIKKYVYSAILDPNTCSNCEEWDGVEADSPDELPETPNPDCDGQGSCRCFIISVFSSEVG